MILYNIYYITKSIYWGDKRYTNRASIIWFHVFLSNLSIFRIDQFELLLGAEMCIHEKQGAA